MTNPTPDVQEQARGDLLLEWFRANSRQVSIAGIGVVVVALGYLFYVKQQALKVSNGDRALAEATSTMAQGNLDLAVSDLKKVAERYKGSPPGDQAALSVAQLQYDQKKYKEGVQLLESVAGSASPVLVSSIQGLIGDGYSEMGKPADAATWYDKAAKSTVYQGEKTALMAKAARAYGAAGQADKARAIWAEIAANPKIPAAAAEARLRLGELTAPAGPKG